MKNGIKVDAKAFALNVLEQLTEQIRSGEITVTGAGAERIVLRSEPDAEGVVTVNPTDELTFTVRWKE